MPRLGGKQDRTESLDKTCYELLVITGVAETPAGCGPVHVSPWAACICAWASLVVPGQTCSPDSACKYLMMWHS